MLSNLLPRLVSMQTPIATIFLAGAALFLLFDPATLLKGVIALVALGLGWDALKWVVLFIATAKDDDDDTPDNNDFDPRHPVHAAGFATPMN